jgi:uncharacterized protein Yka (UPF0111/DUF47 family)
MDGFVISDIDEEIADRAREVARLLMLVQADIDDYFASLADECDDDESEAA